MKIKPDFEYKRLVWTSKQLTSDIPRTLSDVAKNLGVDLKGKPFELDDAMMAVGFLEREKEKGSVSSSILTFGQPKCGACSVRQWISKNGNHSPLSSAEYRDRN